MYYLDLIGTFAFAITGALKAKGRDMHLFGALFLGTITAIGGGTIRDLIIGRTPLFYLEDPNYLIAAIVASALTYFVPTFFKKWYSFFRFIDSIGLSAFIIIGVSTTYTYLFNAEGFTIISFLASILLGMMTGFGGGVVRDAIMGDVPLSLKKDSNYVTSAFLGSLSFYLLMFVNITLAITFSITVTLFFREIISSFGLYKKIFKKHERNGVIL
ncbi:MAG: trimeric intracellular cation channel family protein [Actinomycetota bacterium]|nr:trimeric intracellular cation channel family protein [Actinomycetota bacterium]